jgi:hypothetical protein
MIQQRNLHYWIHTCQGYVMAILKSGLRRQSDADFMKHRFVGTAAHLQDFSFAKPLKSIVKYVST